MAASAFSTLHLARNTQLDAPKRSISGHNVELRAEINEPKVACTQARASNRDRTLRPERLGRAKRARRERIVNADDRETIFRQFFKELAKARAKSGKIVVVSKMVVFDIRTMASEGSSNANEPSDSSASVTNHGDTPSYALLPSRRRYRQHKPSIDSAMTQNRMRHCGRRRLAVRVRRSRYRGVLPASAPASPPGAAPEYPAARPPRIRGLGGRSPS